jgi:hypothetical protein
VNTVGLWVAFVIAPAFLAAGLVGLCIMMHRDLVIAEKRAKRERLEMSSR